LRDGGENFICLEASLHPFFPVDKPFYQVNPMLFSSGRGDMPTCVQSIFILLTRVLFGKAHGTNWPISSSGEAAEEGILSAGATKIRRQESGDVVSHLSTLPWGKRLYAEWSQTEETRALITGFPDSSQV
jgi:hypothetical protein